MTLEILRARKRMFDAVRGHLDGAGFLEVDTPALAVSPGLEPHLVAFETELFRADGSHHTRYLHTSPEYAMKKLLGAGSGPIYQLCHVFRNGEQSSTHLPEFTLLEFYRCPGGSAEIMDDTEAVLRAVAKAVDGSWQPAGAQRLSVSEAFVRVGQPDPLRMDHVEQFRAETSVRTASDDSWEDVFARILFECVEPSFDPNAITILHGYPASMAALSRIDPTDPRRALRFEVYVGGLELGNAFDELVDADEQLARLKKDQEVRAALGRAVYPIDWAFVESLKEISSAAGIALGLDRYLMKCLGHDKVQDVVPLS